MINIVSQKVDKKKGTVTVHVRPQDIRMGAVKLSAPQVEEILTAHGIKRGKKIAGDYTISNKKQFPDDYALVYELASPVKRTVKKDTKKVEENLDKSSEPVKIKKTITRRKKTGG